MRIEHRALASLDLDRAIDALIGRHPGARQLSENGQHRGMGRGHRIVDRPGYLIVAFRHIDHGVVAVDHDPGADYRLRTVQFLSVEPVLREIFTVRQLGDGRPQHRLGIILQAGHAVRRQVEPVTIEQALHQLAAAHHGGDLGVEIADDDLRQPDIGGDDLLYRPIAEVLLGIDAHGRQNQPFLEQLGRVRVGPGDRPADFEMMADAAREGGQPVTVEDRQDEDDIVQMLAVLIGIVGDEGVGRPHRRQIVLGADERHSGSERVHMHRDRLRLCDRPRLPVHDAGRAVLRLAHYGGIGRKQKDVAHLLRDGFEGAGDDVEIGRVDLAHRMLRCAPTRRRFLSVQVRIYRVPPAR